MAQRKRHTHPPFLPASAPPNNLIGHGAANFSRTWQLPSAGAAKEMGINNSKTELRLPLPARPRALVLQNSAGPSVGSRRRPGARRRGQMATQALALSSCLMGAGCQTSPPPPCSRSHPKHRAWELQREVQRGPSTGAPGAASPSSILPTSASHRASTRLLSISESLPPPAPPALCSATSVQRGLQRINAGTFLSLLVLTGQTS